MSTFTVLNSYDKHSLTRTLAGAYVKAWRLSQDEPKLYPGMQRTRVADDLYESLLDLLGGSRFEADRAIGDWLRAAASHAEAEEAWEQRRTQRPERVDAAVRAWFALSGCARDEEAYAWLRGVVFPAA